MTKENVRDTALMCLEKKSLSQMSACVLSHVQLFARLWTVACQAPLSIGFFLQARILEGVSMLSSKGSS